MNTTYKPLKHITAIAFLLLASPLTADAQTAIRGDWNDSK